MQSIRNILSKQTSNTQPITRRYAQTNPKGEFLPICWKKTPSKYKVQLWEQNRAVTFANIFISAIETEIINKRPHKPLVWKRFIDDIFSLWNVDKEEIYSSSFIELANSHHPTIKFTAEVSETETAFLDTCIYKEERFEKESILDVRTHFKPTETFQYTYFSSCHPPGVKKGFIKGEALRLLRTNSSEKTFEENITNFKRRLRMRVIEIQ